MFGQQLRDSFELNKESESHRLKEFKTFKLAYSAMFMVQYCFSHI